MMNTDVSKICAVITADDFGSSCTVNLAVAVAYDRGVLTAASIMPGGDAFSEAVTLAKKRNGLCVGLHVTLCDGRAVLPPSQIPDLVDTNGFFEKNPARAWLRYSKDRLREQLDAEIGAQFDRLEEAGIRPAHVDSHHHLHMHPTLFRLVCEHAGRRKVRWIRIPCEPFRIMMVYRNSDRRIASMLEWFVFRALRNRNLKQALGYGLRVLPWSYGLSRTGQVDTEFLFKIFEGRNPSIEIFTHPDRGTPNGRQELDALTSQVLRVLVGAGSVRLVGYRARDLACAVPFEQTR